MALFEGKPIKPAVNRLMEWFDKRGDKDVFLHQDIAFIAECEYPSDRYGTVVQSWRKRLMRELNVDLEAVIGHGYRMLTDNERVRVGLKDFALSVKQMDRSSERILRADAKKLDDHHRKQQDHAVRLLTELVTSGRKASRAIGFAGRVVTLPRPEKDKAA